LRERSSAARERGKCTTKKYAIIVIRVKDLERGKVE